MAALLFLFLLAIKTLTAQTTLSHGPLLLLPVTKDIKTLQYTTQLLIGTPQLPTKLVVDLSGNSLWVNCPPSSSSRHFIKSDSLTCLMAKPTDHQSTTSHTICNIHEQNPITGTAGVGDLAEDVVSFAGGGSVFSEPPSAEESLQGRSFLISCASEYLLNGLVNGANGVLGLGRSKIALHSQLVNNLDFPRKFTVCLSSSSDDHGFIVFGTGVSNSLSYTPLVSTDTDQYYVNVNSIRISGRKVALNDGKQKVKISSIVPYTIMKSTIYKIFTKAYIKSATSMNMTMVAPPLVGPFGVCFRSQRVFPEIELVLQSELVKWRIEKRNLMVQVSDSVMCLGFVDGGMDLTNSVVLGGYQLEDHILEFNLGTGMMGFSSSSLLIEGNSCSKIRGLISRSIESL